MKQPHDIARAILNYQQRLIINETIFKLKMLRPNFYLTIIKATRYKMPPINLNLLPIKPLISDHELFSKWAP